MTDITGIVEEIRYRRLKVLAQVMDQPHFDQAIEELRQELAAKIADCTDHAEADDLRARRDALARLRGRMQTYINEIAMTEKPNG